MNARTTAVAATLLALSLAAPSRAEVRRAFVTSTRGGGALQDWSDSAGVGGLAGGDNICRAHAAVAGLPNALTYRAWLSDSTTDAWCHVQGLTGTKDSACNGDPLPGAGPWMQVDGTTPFLGSLAEATGLPAVIYNPVQFDESGVEVSDSGSFAWTGTGRDGRALGSTCSGWTTSSGTFGELGDATTTIGLWTDLGTGFCTEELRLVCLEPGAGDPVAIDRSPASIAFVTGSYGSTDLGSWPQAGSATGIDAGDAICRQFALDAGLPVPESFVAWLSDSAHDARDRIVSNGPFVRLDGIRIADTKDDLLDGVANSSLHIQQEGTSLLGAGQVATGTLADGTASGSDCDGWTAATAFQVTAGSSSSARTGQWTDSYTPECGSSGWYLYCVSNALVIFWDGFEQTGDTSRWTLSRP